MANINDIDFGTGPDTQSGDFVAAALQKLSARIALLAASPSGTVPSRAPAVFPFGTNLGAAGTNVGAEGSAWRMPSEALIDKASSDGFTQIRLPFRWNNFLAVLGGDRTADAATFVARVKYALNKGMEVLLDPHDQEHLLTVTLADAASAAQLVTTYKLVFPELINLPGVILGTGNEPQNGEAWRTCMYAFVPLARAANITNELSICDGFNNSNANKWVTQGSDNFFRKLIRLDDLRRVIPEAHIYFDDSQGGLHDGIVAGADSVLDPLLTDAAEGNYPVIIGEMNTDNSSAAISQHNAIMQKLYAAKTNVRGYFLFIYDDTFLAYQDGATAVNSPGGYFMGLIYSDRSATASLTSWKQVYQAVLSGTAPAVYQTPGTPELTDHRTANGDNTMAAVALKAGTTAVLVVNGDPSMALTSPNLTFAGYAQGEASVATAASSGSLAVKAWVMSVPTDGSYDISYSKASGEGLFFYHLPGVGDYSAHYATHDVSNFGELSFPISFSSDEAEWIIYFISTEQPTPTGNTENDIITLPTVTSQYLARTIRSGAAGFNSVDGNDYGCAVLVGLKKLAA